LHVCVAVAWGCIAKVRGGSFGAAFLRIGGGWFGGRILRGATLGFGSSHGGPSEFRDQADPSIGLSEGVSRNGAPITPLVRLSRRSVFFAYSKVLLVAIAQQCSAVAAASMSEPSGRCHGCVPRSVLEDFPFVQEWLEGSPSAYRIGLGNRRPAIEKG